MPSGAFKKCMGSTPTGPDFIVLGCDLGIGIFKSSPGDVTMSQNRTQLGSVYNPNFQDWSKEIGRMPGNLFYFREKDFMYLQDVTYNSLFRPS